MTDPLVFHDVPPADDPRWKQVAEAIRRDQWDRAGLASGHAWAPCDTCGAEALQPRTGGRRCFLTPGCPGTHRPPVDRQTPLQALRAGEISLDDIRANPPRLNATLRRLLGESA